MVQMTWNYRMIRYNDEKGFGIHEVYYDEDGEPDGMTVNAVSFAVGYLEDGPEDLARSLKQALSDATKLTILDESLFNNALEVK